MTHRRTKVTVLVTGIGGGAVGEQVLKALRLAGGYRIVGCDARPQSPQFDIVDQPVVVPFASSPHYMEALLTVCQRYGVRALFPGSEPELLVISQNRAVIESEGIFLPICPPDAIAVGMDKLRTAAFLLEHGFQAPRSQRLGGLDDLESVDWFPVVVKPFRNSGGSRDCFVAQSPHELELVAELLLRDNDELMLQEYVGSPEHEYTVGVLCDMNGEVLNSIGMRRIIEGPLHTRLKVRNRTGRAELGEWLVISSGVSHGFIGQFPEVARTCEEIAVALRARAAINLQCRLVGGQVQVFEINPRMSGTTSLRAMVGFNEPDILIRHDLLGEDVPARFPYRSALILRSLTERLASTRAVPNWASG